MMVQQSSNVRAPCQTSPFQLPFNKAISKMQDTGVLQKLLDGGYYTKYGRARMTDGQDVEVPKPIENLRMVMAYVTLLIGLFLSLLTFAMEILLEKCMKKEGNGGPVFKQRHVGLTGKMSPQI